MINLDLFKTQKYLDWIKQELFLDAISGKSRGRSVKRGEVYWCELGQGIGSEECKKRPCVILQNDAGNHTSPNTIVAPITHSSSTLSIVIPITPKTAADGSQLDGNALLGSINTVSKARLGDFIAVLDSADMDKIDEALAISTDIKRHYDKLKTMYNDKIDHIKRLKEKQTSLENELSKAKENYSKLLQITSKSKENLGDDSIEDLNA